MLKYAPFFIKFYEIIEIMLVNCVCLFLVVREFCRISMDFIRKGANPKVYQGAARKCNSIFHNQTDKITTQHCPFKTVNMLMT